MSAETESDNDQEAEIMITLEEETMIVITEAVTAVVETVEEMTMAEITEAITIAVAAVLAAEEEVAAETIIEEEEIAVLEIDREDEVIDEYYCIKYYLLL